LWGRGCGELVDGVGGGLGLGWGEKGVGGVELYRTRHRAVFGQFRMAVIFLSGKLAGYKH